MWLAIFEKFILPWLLQELIKSGVMNQLEASAISTAADFIEWIKSLKTYSAPEDFPKQDQKGQAFP